jgi:hypothetical protein
VIWSGVLRARLREARNRFRRGARGSRWQTLVALLLFAWFFALVFATLHATFSHADLLGLGDAGARALLAALLAGALAGVLVFDLQYAVAAVLIDSDLELLRRAPLSPRQLLGLKVIDSLPRTAALIAGVALPACLAYGSAVGLPWWGWGMLPLLLASLWAAPLGVGLALGLLLLRLVPARRVRETLAVLSTLVVLGLWLLNSFAMPRLLDTDTDIAARLAQRLTPAAWLVQISPAHWAAAALTGAREGLPVAAWAWTTRLVAAALLSLGIAGVAARGLLDDVLARVTSGESRTTRRRVGPRRLAPGGFAALLLKDARLFTRDWTVLGDVLTAGLLWTLLPLVASPLHEAPPRLLARFMLVALAVGLGYEIGARTLPFEGAALAWSRLAPLPPWRWNLAKWSGGLVLSLPLIALSAVAVRLALPLDAAGWAQAVIGGLSALVLALAIGLWTGWIFGDPNWTNPRAMLTFSGRVIASGMLLAQAGAWLALLALADIFASSLPPGAGWWGPPALAMMVALPVLALAERAARRHQWTG